ncbi:serine/threonine-protein kinase mtor [Anaeramoeba flamelloides]|uniref:Serine/threonine-protein kinase TOR n=1 Tax=Anaeramoeba flamelloides TaxID=1746091 RepID=A0AAV7YNJ2_9EUKA|nr:serine/threonine-protein kinase mtor [Anaeramoeba flamelloides]
MSQKKELQSIELKLLLQQLEDRSFIKRSEASRLIKKFANDKLREQGRESLQIIFKQIMETISELMNNEDETYILGACQAIDELLFISSQEDVVVFARFGGYLRIALTCENIPILHFASQTLGKLARIGGQIAQEVIEYEMRVALGYLQDERNKGHRMAAVLIILELTQLSDSTIYSHIPMTFERIWCAVWDKNLEIRKTAAIALGNSLKLIAKKSEQLRIQWTNKIYLELKKGFKTNNSETIHGSFLIIYELFQISKDILLETFKEICDFIFNYKDNKSPDIRKAVYILIPILAKCNKENFEKDYLSAIVKYLEKSLKKYSSERIEIFQCFGKLSLSLGTSFEPYLNIIIKMIQEALNSNKKKRYCPESIECFGMLAECFKKKIIPISENFKIFQSIYKLPLTEKLINLLKKLIKELPGYSTNIHQNLYVIITNILKSVSLQSSQSQQLFTQQSEYNSIILSLKCLTIFEFDLNETIQFIKNYVCEFLHETDHEIRKQSALTCMHILIESETNELTNVNTVQNEILDKLLILAITDSNLNIRLSILKSINNKLDHKLSKSNKLSPLFYTLNDENFEIRYITVTIIGRLSSLNPTFIVPSLRKILIQLLTELEYNKNLKTQEKSLKLLTHMIESIGSLIKPYSELILKNLIPKLYSNSKQITLLKSSIINYILIAIGRLSIYTKKRKMKQYIEELIGFIIKILQDQIPNIKIKITLRTLFQLLNATGYVIDPYKKFPQLLLLLLRIFRIKNKPHIRKEIMQILGLIGAIDPYDLKMNFKKNKINSNNNNNQNKNNHNNHNNHNHNHNHNHSNNIHNNNNSNEISGGDNYSSISGINSKEYNPIQNNSTKNEQILPGFDLIFDNYYPTIVINELIKILKDNSLRQHFSMIIRTLMTIFKSIKLRTIQFLPKVLPTFFNLMRNCENIMREFLFKQLRILICFVKEHIYKYLTELVSIIQQFWLPQYYSEIILLIKDLCLLKNDEFKIQLPELIPYMIEILETNNIDENIKINVLIAFKLLSDNLEDYLHIVIPSIIKILDDKKNSINLKSNVLTTIGGLSLHINLLDFASRIIHPISRILINYNVNSIKNFYFNKSDILDQNHVNSNNSSNGLNHINNEILKNKELINDLNNNNNLIQNKNLHLHNHNAKDSKKNNSNNSNNKNKSNLKKTNSMSNIINKKSFLNNTNHLINEALNTLSKLVIQLNKEYLIFIPMIEKIMVKYDIKHIFYSDLVEKLINNKSLTGKKKGQVRIIPKKTLSLGIDNESQNHFRELIQKNSKLANSLEDIMGSSFLSSNDLNTQIKDKKNSSRMQEIPITKLLVDQNTLKDFWSVGNYSNQEEWDEWVTNFSLQLLRQSPSPAIRSCSSLAQIYCPLARRLFNAAFLSCWNELDEYHQEHLIYSLEIVFNNFKSISTEILQILLNLAEFMEHVDKPLPITISKLGELAEKCHAYSQALHYKEIEFQLDPKLSIEGLIAINNQLEKPQAAIGILKFAQKNLNLELKETWYEQLNRWQNALNAYQNRINRINHNQNVDGNNQSGTNNNNHHSSNDKMINTNNRQTIFLQSNQNLTITQVVLGKMRCLNALCEWDELIQMAQEYWIYFQTNGKQNCDNNSNHNQKYNQNVLNQIAPLVVNAYFNLRNYEEMNNYIQIIDKNCFEGAFWRAIIEINNENYPKAKEFINLAQDNVSKNLNTLIFESYSRQYNEIINLQQLIELEEAIQYKKATRNSNVLKQKQIKQNYSKRLLNCKKEINIWQRILSVQSIVIPPKENIEIWLKFAKLSIKNGKNFTLAERSIRKFIDSKLINTQNQKIKILSKDFQSLHPKVALNYLELLWQNQNNENEKEITFKSLQQLCNKIPPPSIFEKRRKEQERVERWKIKQQRELRISKDNNEIYQKEEIKKQRKRREKKKQLKIIKKQEKIRRRTFFMQKMMKNKNNHLNEKVNNNGSSSSSSSSNNSDGKGVEENENKLKINKELNGLLKEKFGLEDHKKRKRSKKKKKLLEKKQMLKEKTVLAKDSKDLEKANSRLRAKYFLTLGKWGLNNIKLTRGEKQEIALDSFKLATEYDKSWYKAWHNWAFFNFQIIFQKKFNSNHKKLGSNNKNNKFNNGDDKLNPEMIQNYLIPSIKGFFKSISLNPGNQSVQDILRLLTLWFEYGEYEVVSKTILNEFVTVSIDTWLKVIPQIIARINTPIEQIREVICYLLNEVGKVHPQALVFPLTVSYISENETKKMIKIAQRKRRLSKESQKSHLQLLQIINKNNGNGSKKKKRKKFQRKRSKLISTQDKRPNLKSNLDFKINGEPINDFEFQSSDSEITSDLEFSDDVKNDHYYYTSSFSSSSSSDSSSDYGSFTDLYPDENGGNETSNLYKINLFKHYDENQNNKNNLSESLMEEMRNHSSNLVNDAELVSSELIRIGILWEELWNKGLEQASKAYFGQKDVIQMLMELQPLHEMISRGPSTMRELSFLQNYERDLIEAQEWCKKYLKKPDIGHLTQAWNLYYKVFEQIGNALPKMTNLKLSYMSPELNKVKNLELAMPGTYKAGKKIIKIKEFYPTADVILSKQRPRKIKIKGNNGKMYKFLLKGHEDPRLDERVMQLFGLVNTLLKQESSKKSSQQHLKITRYSVIPLSTNSGIIEWVPHCDTMHELIREYRNARKIFLDLERRVMLEMTPEYDQLKPIQKIEIFTNSLDQTEGEDLEKILWLKSTNSENWLERRTNYTRSLALMSMVGYILGLGDRHPSNLMMEIYTGKILHIDFGDCFEVTRERDKFPEKIPFRLTRMLIKAMGVSGIEGNFRNTCESVMQLLRNNKDSLMAMLEAFVHDPLLTWQLVDEKKEINEDKFTKVRDVDEHKNTKNQTQKFQLEMLQSIEIKNSMKSSINQTLPNDIKNKSKSSVINNNDSDRSNFHNRDNLKNNVNEEAIKLIKRIEDKLTGRDFDPNKTLDVTQQVEMLIEEASSVENLCQCYNGWCPFW